MEDLLRLEELLARARREVQNTQGKFNFLIFHYHCILPNCLFYVLISGLIFSNILQHDIPSLHYTSRIHLRSLQISHTNVAIVQCPCRMRDCVQPAYPTCRICKRRLLQHLFTADYSRLCQVSIVFLLEHRSILFLVFASFHNRQ